MKILSDNEIDEQPHVFDLKQYDTGTLVIWTKFDKIEGAEMAVVKNLETNKYYLYGIETYIHNVKEN